MQAFSAPTEFLADFDKRHRTVIMVQVENEIGLPDARDHHPGATAAFQGAVPSEARSPIR